MTRTGLEPAPDADAFLSTRPTVPVVATDWLLEVRITSRGHGATAARLTPDQKVGSSNLSALIAHHLLVDRHRRRFIEVSAAASFFLSDININWPCGLMDKALVFGTKDCRFESCQGQVLLAGSATTA